MAILSPNQKTIVNLASRVAIDSAFSNLSTSLLTNNWLNPANSYLANTVVRIKNDLHNNCLNQADLIDCVAASAPLHCFDGWSYLGRAIDSLARGDSDSARHLAYYAELRAAISILATEGYGIFNNIIFAIDQRGNCLQIPSPPSRQHNNLGTHQITWLIYEEWSNSQSAIDLLGKIIKPNNISLDIWLSKFGYSPLIRPIGYKLLTEWGLDLQIFSQDRNSRNESSYRPTRLENRQQLNSIETSKFICNLWELCKPSFNSSFENLDKYFLRITLEEYIKSVYTIKGDPSQSSQYKTFIGEMLRDLIDNNILNASLVQIFKLFFRRKFLKQDPIVFEMARRRDPIGNPENQIQIISRALLLLRVATGSCDILFKKSGINTQNLEFWWIAVGKERGFWEIWDHSIALIDLWSDTEIAITELKNWHSKTLHSTYSEFRQQERIQHIMRLGECEKINFWGLGL